MAPADSDQDEPPSQRRRSKLLWILGLYLVSSECGVAVQGAVAGRPVSSILVSRVEFLDYLQHQGGTAAFLELELRRAAHLEAPGALELGLARDSSCDILSLVSLDLRPWQGQGLGEEVVSLSALLPVEGVEGGSWSLCLREDKGQWQVQGVQLLLPGAAGKGIPLEEEGHRQRRAMEGGEVRGQEARVYALLLSRTTSHNQYLATGSITVYDSEQFELVLSGVGLDTVKAVKFTTVNNTFGDNCHGDGAFHTSHTFTEFEEQASPGLRSLAVPGLKYWADQPIYYICLATEEPDQDGNYDFYHQGGEDKTLQIKMDKALLPIWVMISLIVVLLCMSGLFSGLNLGLMSLDQTELKIVQNTGSDKEKGYATAIMPVRAMGNFLLCSILLGNVLVNNTLTILLDTLTGGGGLVAVIGATMGIVVFGEIIPQAICSRHGLAVGAKTIWLTKFFMLLTAPLSFPISKVLDCLLGTEIGTVYNKTRLMELLKVTEQYNGLERDEINIVTGALVLKQKSVKDVMTNIEDCYMLPNDARLDFDVISEIKEQGYSRIPVYRAGNKADIIHILFAKDLLFVDPDDEKPIEEICKFYRNDVNFVYSDTILTDMFDEFKSGEKGHLALVQEYHNDVDTDPFYETVGLVTLEDIIEEIIQQEIIDETDVVIDNKSKKKRKRERYKKDAEVKMFQGARHMVNITPHENMAVLQFLTTSVKAFSPEIMGENILRKLLSMDVYRELKIKESKESRNNNEEQPDDKAVILMTKGKTCDYFIMIIEGKVEVTIGKEERKFQDGPFSCYGAEILEHVAMNLNPSSPLVGSRGINSSLSMQSNVSHQDVKSAPHLKKTATQLQLNENGKSGRRSTSADVSLPALQKATFIPDYTLKALTDLVYLKVRRNTYTVAIKATRMATTNSGEVNYNELSDVLAKVIEQDAEIGQTPSIRSPDKDWDQPLRRSTNELSGADLRRESIRSSLSAMKRLVLGGQAGGKGRSLSHSVEQGVGGERKEEYLDGVANPALVEEARHEADSSAESGSNQSTGPRKETGNGAPPNYLPLAGAKRGDAISSLPALQRDKSEPLNHSRNTFPLQELEGGQVVGASGARREEPGSQGSSPSDRTSLLHTEHPVS